MPIGIQNSATFFSSLIIFLFVIGFWEFLKYLMSDDDEK